MTTPILRQVNANSSVSTRADGGYTHSRAVRDLMSEGSAPVTLVTVMDKVLSQGERGGGRHTPKMHRAHAHNGCKRQLGWHGCVGLWLRPNPIPGHGPKGGQPEQRQWQRPVDARHV